MDLNPISIALFIYPRFATNDDVSSQLGFITVVMDSNMKANIILYASNKSRWVPRSGLATEVFAMVFAFAVSSTIRISLNEIFNELI